MKRTRFFKFFINLILALCLLFACGAVSFAADEAADADTFLLSVYPEKSEYQKGEEIKFITSLHNKTGEAIENVMLIADVPKTDTYLTRGASEIQYTSIEAGKKVSGEFRFSEYEAVVKIGTVLAGLSGIIGAIFIFFVWQYNAIASIVLTISMIFTSAFAAAPSSLLHLTAIRESQNLGTCKVVYDGAEYEFGFHASYEKKLVKTRYDAIKSGKADGAFETSAKVSESANGMSGIIFGSEIDKNDFEGYLFFINPSQGATGIIVKNGDEYSLASSKKVNIKKNQAYEMKITSDGKTAKCYLYNSSLDSEPYPVFDIPVNFKGNDIGTYSSKKGTVTDVKISAFNYSYNGETYTNPVMPDGADPYVLFHDGTYYLYITNGFSANGFEAYTSKDLVNWNYAGVVAEKPDILGEYNFWAPEVYYYNNRFYMLYSAQEYSAVAVADSPLGPFRKTSDNFLFDFNAIDGNLLFDDDGRIYMYFSRILHSEGEGQQIWGVEMNGDLLSAKLDTLTLLTAPNKQWEGWVNEAPFMLKHNGTYYLSYSGDFYFNINYNIGYATSDSPLGTFTRYENNPIVSADSFVHGTGHHAFVPSPDGSELFIVYHCHNSTTQVHNRKICIDRVKFVPTESGVDALSVYGPTVTPQPVPSALPYSDAK